ncbi:MAG TPA: LodA/GoxA family CTQ-dependent oxidase [Pyrinomonadaceae bacterium]
MAITSVKIFPPIGIARIGNSPEFFIGPEIPGVRTPPPGGYKDASCRVKRQAARFRLFAYDENGDLIIENNKPKEITAADAEIKWTVELANKKSAYKRFEGLNQNAPLRNAGVAMADRPTLEITPGPRTLDGPNQAAGFNTGKFLGKTVPLGEMRTDADGRLLVLGGFGNSGSVPDGIAITNYANNDGWHDDISDGPVKATVKLNGGMTTLDAVPAWVLCPPPDFAPPIDSITTLYDLLTQVAVNKGLLTAPSKPSFTQHVYPTLQRVLDLQPVNQFVTSGHFSFESAYPPPTGTNSGRQSILNRLRNPNNPGAVGQATMPILWDDNHEKKHTVTKLQYAAMQKWVGTEGVDWTNDWTGAPPAPPADITPDGLTRAALEACVGLALYPGIEAGWFLRDVYDYSEPYRLSHTGRGAGDVSKQMAVPWQADFHDCYEYGGAAWWPAQRPDDVFPEAGGGPVKWNRDLATSREEMIENWHKLGFVVNKNGQMVETERRVVCTNIFLVTDRSNFSEDEVSGVLTGGVPAVFPDALYVIAEGFLPAELGVTIANPTPAQLAPIAPTLTFKREDNNDVPDMKATAQKLLLQNNALPPDLRQRFTFVYQVEFDSTDGFKDDNQQPIETQVVTVKAEKNAAGQDFTSGGFLTLFHHPNPYMKDGPTSWLSTDVRVFQVTDGGAPFGFALGPVGADTPSAGKTAATNFVEQLINNFNASAGQPNHPFDTISINQATSKLELSEKVGGKRVFNFAVARVRYRGNVLPADDVKVFFRLFTTAATGLDYDVNSTYRRTPALVDPGSLLGLQAGHLVTIPCYARPRVDTAAVSIDMQPDDLNKRTLTPAGGGAEFHGYYACWLDFNQTPPQFPLQPSPADGPWNAGRKSVQELIRGQHQCLVAEVYYQNDPVPNGASPASNDNLAQRNLAIVESDNPGSLATHTVQHTFEIKATRPARQRPLPAAFVGTTAAVRSSFVAEAGPDELMIRWNNLPQGTRMSLYMPDLEAEEVLRLAGQSNDYPGLEAVDAHTIDCLPADVTYVPIPPGRTRNVAALLTVELPEGVKRGQEFRAVVHQISGSPRVILGAFQFGIPVSDKSVLLEPEKRKLSVLRHIAQAIPPDDQWRHVFTRYLEQIAERVRGFGGDPDRVGPAPDGSGSGRGDDFHFNTPHDWEMPGGDAEDKSERRCRRRGWVFSALLAALVVVAVVHPLGGYVAELLMGICAAAAFLSWRKHCRPSPCRMLSAVLVGLALGTAFGAVLLLAGFGGARGFVVLVKAIIALCLVVLAGVRARCFTP